MALSAASDLGLHYPHRLHKKDAMLIWVYESCLTIKDKNGSHFFIILKWFSTGKKEQGESPQEQSSASQDEGKSEIEKLKIKTEKWMGTLTTMQLLKAKEYALKDVGEEDMVASVQNVSLSKDTANCYRPNPLNVLTLYAPIATKVVCFSRLLKCLRSLYGKQCGPRPDCSYRSSLFWVHTVCFYT